MKLVLCGFVCTNDIRVQYMNWFQMKEHVHVAKNLLYFHPSGPTNEIALSSSLSTGKPLIDTTETFFDLIQSDVLIRFRVKYLL